MVYNYQLVLSINSYLKLLVISQVKYFGKHWKKIKDFYNDIVLENLLDLKISILIFLRAISESNFNVQVLSLKSLMKLFFALHHYNYARFCITYYW